MADDVIKTDYALQKECEALAVDIYNEVMITPFEEVALGNLSDCDPDDWRDEMLDRAHEVVDGHEAVIYYYRALQICANCNTDQGEQFLEETGMPESPTFNGLACIIAYGEMKARIEEYIDHLIGEYDPDGDDASDGEPSNIEVI